MWVVLEYRPDGTLGCVHGPFVSLRDANRWCDRHLELHAVPWPLASVEAELVA